MRFANPLFLLLLIPLAAAAWYYFERERKNKAALLFSDFRIFKGLGNFSSNKRQVLLWLRARFEFILIDNLVKNRQQVSAPWREHRSEGNSSFLWQLLFFALTLAALLSVLLPGALLFLNLLSGHAPKLEGEQLKFG